MGEPESTRAGAPSGTVAPRLVPRDAATIVLVDRTMLEPRILLGRRRADLAFLAGKFVFPGGRVDPADGAAAIAEDPHPATISALMTGMRGRPSVRRARALAVAAARELAEETGLALGEHDSMRLGCLTYIARAITPPGRVRRYDTRFFMAPAERLADRTLGGDGELRDLGWFGLDAVRALDLPGITRLIVEDIAALLPLSGAAQPPSVPFYFHRRGAFHRELL